MLDKLQALEDRYLDLEAKISDPEVIADQTTWLKATKAHAKLEPIVTAYREYRDMCKAVMRQKNCCKQVMMLS